MNKWTTASITIATQEDYLDRLYEIYPSNPEGEREISEEELALIKTAFDNKDDQNLLLTLLEMPLFPLKDSYVAFLKKDKTAIQRNPQTVKRLTDRIYNMGIERLLKEISQPKEANRQMGQRFRQWLTSGNLNVPCLSADDFLHSAENCILQGDDASLKNFAKEELRYNSKNGLDLVAKFNNRYVIGEAKFLTAFGGHQDRQFESAVSIFDDPANANKIAIMDGVLYIPNKGRMHRYLEENPRNPVFSVLMLQQFLKEL